MKRNEFVNEIKKLSSAEMKAKARGLAEELMKLRFRKASGQLEQSHRLGDLKRNLARIETFLKTSPENKAVKKKA